MPVYCCVKNCKNNSVYNRDLKFYEIPKIWTRSPKLRKLSEIRLNKWFEAINRKKLNIKSSRICSIHFHSGKCALLQDRLNPDWVPSLHLGKKISTTQVTLSSSSEDNDDDDILEDNISLNQEELGSEPTLEQNNSPRRVALNCCVPYCKNVRSKFEKKVIFFRFPNANEYIDEKTPSSERLSAWLHAIKRVDITHLNAKYKIICSEHFQTGSPASADDRSHPDWIPNKKLPSTFTKAVRQKSSSNKPNNSDLIDSESLFDPLAEVEIKILPKSEIADNKIEFQKIKLENELLKKQLAEKDLTIRSHELKLNKLIASHELEKKEKNSIIQILEKTNLRTSLSRESFINDDKKVNYFTGLPNYPVLEIIYGFVEKDLVCCLMKGVNKFDALILVLMKLRLDLPLAYIGYRYGVSRNTSATIFHTNLKMLSVKIGQFIRWPEKAALRKNTSVYFKRVLGKNFTALIDFIEDPGPHVSEVYIQQKKYIKQKYLVAISPAGAIIFVSKGYDSSLSVKEIAERCGFLDHTDDGDVIFSDHGTISHQVCVYNGSKVLIESSHDVSDDVHNDTIHPTSSKIQTEADSCRTYPQRSISNLLNKYFVLSNKYKVSLLRSYKNTEGERYFDYVIKVCCALTNVSPVILSLETKNVS